MSDRAAQLVAQLPRLIRPEAAGRTRMTVQLDLTGDGGGQWWVTVAGGACTVGTGRAGKPDATLTASAEDYVLIRTGRLDPLTATMDGRLRVEGRYGLAVRFAKMFDTAD